MRGVVLLFLLSLWPGGKVDAINQEVLANVVQEMRRYGQENQQYAMAVLLTQQQCTQNRAIFDVGVKSQVVQKELTDRKVYIGQRLIAAKPDTYHAEYRLLSGGNSSPMQTLINKANHNAGDCIVFFSTYSPCLEWCNLPGGDYNILPFMDVFKDFDNNRKAFVFSLVWDPSINPLRSPSVTKPPRQQVLDSFRRIDAYLPLYRCVTFQANNKLVNRCYRCITTNTNAETNDCLYEY